MHVLKHGDALAAQAACVIIAAEKNTSRFTTPVSGLPLSMRSLMRLALFSGLSAGALGVWLAWFALSPLPLRGKPPLDFSIPPGLSTRAAAQQMAAAGIDFAPWQFALLARLLGKEKNIKAGSYEIEAGVSPLNLLEKLTRGDVTQAELALIEGKSFRQLRAALDAHPFVRHDSRGLSDQELLLRIGARESHPEGLFFPDTYLFGKGASDVDILKRAYRAMQIQLEREWALRDAGLSLSSPYEALILASIVEKETGAASDRPLVAAVFTNRLRLGMLLQTDPTVIYGMGAGFDGDLRKRDLQTDTPYNTYLRKGLPPTPIAMPGLAALQAALHPPKNNLLYFVARGDGSSVFSRNLEEHNRAVAKYQKGR